MIKAAKETRRESGRRTMTVQQLKPSFQKRGSEQERKHKGYQKENIALVMNKNMNIYKVEKISFPECESCHEEVVGRPECAETMAWTPESEEGWRKGNLMCEPLGGHLLISLLKPSCNSLQDLAQCNCFVVVLSESVLPSRLYTC